MVQTGHLTSNSGTAWPFDPSRHGFDMAVARLFADFSASLQPSANGRPDVLVSDVSVSGTQESPVVSFSVSARMRRDTVRGPERVDAVWSGTPYSAVHGMWFFAVVDMEEASKHIGLAMDGEMAVDGSALNTYPDVVTSVTLVNNPSHDLPDIVVPLRPEGLGLAGGYNAYVGYDAARIGTYGADVMFDGPSVIISFSPGEGDGKVPADCPDTSSASGKGRMTPDAQGDVAIDGDGCVAVVASAAGGGLTLAGRCAPCCSCDDYADTGERLAGQSSRLMSVRSVLVSDAAKYNSWATKFNDSLGRVSADELVVKASVVGQVTGLSGSPGLSLFGVSGTVDRAQGAIALKNLSVADATVEVTASMSPHSIVLASTASQEPSSSSVSGSSSWEAVSGGRLSMRKIRLPSGGSVTIRVVGTRGGTGYSGSCSLSGTATFSWDETSGGTTNGKRLSKTFSTSYSAK